MTKEIAPSNGNGTAKNSLPSMEVVFDNIRHPDIFTQVAKSIQEHVKENKLVTYFKGKDGNQNAYAQVEAWQFAGALLGLFPILTDTKDLTIDRNIKFEATVEIIEQASGKIVGRGKAICSNTETGKQYFQEYAVLSMSQTRAVGKAFRLCLGWIMKAAGFEPAPAEEVEGYDENKPTGITDMKLLAEYKGFAYDAIRICKTAADVEKLVKQATYFKEDAVFLDNARKAYTRLREEVAKE